MRTSVVEKDGKLVYAMLDGADIVEVISEDVEEVETAICEECEIRMGMCTLAAPGKKAVKLCRICLDKRTGAL